MSPPSGLPQIITAGSEAYLERFNPEPEQSAIYRNIHFSCNGQRLFGICVTPQCEMRKPRTIFHTFCQLIPFYFLLENHMKGFGITPTQLEGGDIAPDLGKKTKKCLESFIELYIGHKTHRYHFLPPCGEVKASFVDFQVIECIENVKILANDKVAVLTSPWREELPARYSFYQGRIGVPEFDRKLIFDILKSADLPLVDSVLASLK